MSRSSEQFLMELDKQCRGSHRIIAAPEVQGVKYDEKYDMYALAMQEEQEGEIVFTSASPEGDLYYEDMENHVHVVLRNEIVKGKTRQMNPYFRSEMLNIPIAVKVVSIDEKNNTVYVKSIMKGSPSAAERRRVAKEIDRALEVRIKEMEGTGKRLIVPARVVAVASRTAVLSLFGKGARGLITIGGFSNEYIPDFPSVCKVGQMYDVEVMGRAEQGSFNRNLWYCSRNNLMPSPWKGEFINRYQPGSVIMVKCISAPEQKNYFWGRIDGIEGQTVLCNNTPGIQAVIGGMYKCKVAKLDIEKHLFVATPFELVTRFINTAPLFRKVKKEEVEKKPTEHAVTEEKSQADAVAPVLQEKEQTADDMKRETVQAESTQS